MASFTLASPSGAAKADEETTAKEAAITSETKPFFNTIIAD